MWQQSARGLSESEEDRVFVQRRVALFGLVIGCSYLFVWLYRIVIMLATGHEAGFVEPSFWWHLVATGCFLLLWLTCWRGRRSLRFIRIIEVMILGLGVLATSIMVSYIPFQSRPDFIILLALSNMILGRAIFVPSSGRLTLFHGLIVGAVVLGSVYVGSRESDPTTWAAIFPSNPARDPRSAAVAITIEIAVWWTLATMLSTATSVVIYGLRRRVRDAEQLGQYRLEEKLGEGGMGVVYRASHAFLRRPTAVKLLPPDRAGADDLRRFEQEVQLTASLTHPHTITIFDYGHTADGLFYYAMEYIEGLALTDVVARSGPQPEGRVIHLMRQASSALVEAHGVGLVHRDIKPGNIMVHLSHPYGGGEDFVKVLDFGLVKQVRRDGRIELTNETNLAGTPQYMAPESIISPEAVDPRTDLYALGAVAYYLLTGTHVFTGKSVVEVCGHHLHTAPEPPSSRLGASVAPDLERVLLGCLAKDRSERPQTAFELEQELADCAVVSAWTAHDAHRWWAAHGDRPRAGAREAEGVLTVDVELTSRDDRGRA